MRKLLVPVAALALVLFAFASVASGHTGSVSASEDCQWFHVHVFLDNNVSSDRTVDVTTTIPGTTGITGGHYDTFSNSGPVEILTLSGPFPASGTVTLTISGGGGQEFTDSATITPPECPEPGIAIHKSNDADDTVEPGTAVTYTYEVTNTGDLPLTDVAVNDQIEGGDNPACAPVAYQSSDGNDDDILDPGETWTFTCTTTLQATTSNEACVSANVAADVDEDLVKVDQQSEEVKACDDNTVEVSHSPEENVEAGTGTPAGSIPNTSLDGGGPNPLPTILFSLVLLASLGTLAYANVKVVSRRNR